MEGMGQAWTALAMALGQLQEDPVPSRTPGMGTAMDEPPPCAPFHPGICSSQNPLRARNSPGTGTPPGQHIPIFLWDGIAGMVWVGSLIPSHPAVTGTPPSVPVWNISRDGASKSIHCHFPSSFGMLPKGFTSPFFPFLLGLQDFMDHCGFLILPEFLSSACCCSWLHEPSQLLSRNSAAPGFTDPGWCHNPPKNPKKI